MDTTTTWQPLAETYDVNDNGKLDPRERRALPDSAFAFPSERELPLVDAEHVQAAIGHLDQYAGTSGSALETALRNIRAAAAYFGIEISDRVFDLPRIIPRP